MSIYLFETLSQDIDFMREWDAGKKPNVSNMSELYIYPRCVKITNNSFLLKWIVLSGACMSIFDHVNKTKYDRVFQINVGNYIGKYIVSNDKKSLVLHYETRYFEKFRIRSDGTYMYKAYDIDSNLYDWGYKKTHKLLWDWGSVHKSRYL